MIPGVFEANTKISALGASVLLGAVLRYDRLRADRGDFSK